jgi:hypothetical protein
MMDAMTSMGKSAVDGDGIRTAPRRTADPLSRHPQGMTG